LLREIKVHTAHGSGEKRKTAMKFKSSHNIILEKLEELALKLNIAISYEKGIEGAGGFCRLKDQNLILVNKDLPAPDKIELIAEALIQFPLDDYYIIPELREYLECLGTNQSSH
jgi:hypothetical protein